MKSERMMPMTGPMALLWAGLSSEGSLVISAGGRAGRDGGHQPKRSGSPEGGQALCALEGSYPPRPSTHWWSCWGCWGSTPEGLALSSLPAAASCPSSAGLSSPTAPAPHQRLLLFTPLTWSFPVWALDSTLSKEHSLPHQVGTTVLGTINSVPSSRPPPREREESCWFQQGGLTMDENHPNNWGHSHTGGQRQTWSA